jgi:hypothetical protein
MSAPSPSPCDHTAACRASCGFAQGHEGEAPDGIRAGELCARDGRHHVPHEPVLHGHGALHHTAMWRYQLVALRAKDRDPPLAECVTMRKLQLSKEELDGFMRAAQAGRVA